MLDELPVSDVRFDLPVEAEPHPCTVLSSHGLHSSICFFLGFSCKIISL